MNNTNYAKELEKTIEAIKQTGNIPKLLLHSCCAPCSSYVVEYLSEFFDIGILYYNPNIQPEEEYIRRKEEQRRFANEIKTKNEIEFIDINYETEKFEQLSLGQEDEAEGGARCTDCFRLRLSKTAQIASKEGYDYFCTTLTVSPHKNSKKVNEKGEQMEMEHKIKWLYSDFKKNDGYKKSITLSNKYGLYRQDYCGCEYSKQK